jgi:hypothetical protein
LVLHLKLGLLVELGLLWHAQAELPVIPYLEVIVVLAISVSFIVRDKVGDLKGLLLRPVDFMSIG